MFIDPSRVEIVYESLDCEVFNQTVLDLADVGTLIDPSDGEDMNIIGVEVTPNDGVLKVYTEILNQKIRENRVGDLEEFLKNFLRDSLR